MNISKKLLSILLAAILVLSANICALAAPAGPMDAGNADGHYSIDSDSEKGNAPVPSLLAARRPSGSMLSTAAPAPAARTVLPGHARSLARHCGAASPEAAKHCGKVFPSPAQTAPETSGTVQRTLIINGQEFALDVQVIDGVEYAKLSELAVLLTSAAAEL